MKSRNLIKKDLSLTVIRATTRKYWKLWAFAILIGIIVGIEALIFYAFLDLVRSFSYGVLGIDIGRPAGEPNFFNLDLLLPRISSPLNVVLIVVLPTIGGLLSGLITYCLPPDERSGESSVYIRAFHHKYGVLSDHLPIIRLCASAFFVGMGCSAGREGPIVQIGAASASLLSRKGNLTPRERELLFVAGAAAGIGGIFRAPLGGALFGIEVLYRHDYEGVAFPLAVVSSIISWLIFSLCTGWTPMFSAPRIRLGLKEVPLYIILGICCGLLARFYVKIFNYIKSLFDKLPVKDYVKPAIGGFVVGILAIICMIIVGKPYIFGTGYGPLQLVMSGELFQYLPAKDLMIILFMLLLIVFLKIIATAASLGSKGSGGVFAPSIAIGGFFGAAAGMLFKVFFPDYIINDIGIFVILGMASFFGAAANVPLAAITMTAEITWDFSILVPAIITVGVSYLVALESTVYSEQVENMLSSPVHIADEIFYVLRNLRVKDILSPDSQVFIMEDTPAEEAMNLMMKLQRTVLPVADKDGKYLGIVDIYDLTSLLSRGKQKPVREVIREIMIYAYPEEPLILTLSKATKNRLQAIPVVDPITKKIIGEVTYHDMIKALYAKLEEIGVLR